MTGHPFEPNKDNGCLVCEEAHDQHPKAAEEAKPPQLYYVQDNRTFCGNSVFWWCPNGKGYTTHIDQAGKFVDDGTWSRETDVLWPVEIVDKLWSQHVDMQHLHPHSDSALTKKKRVAAHKDALEQP